MSDAYSKADKAVEPYAIFENQKGEVKEYYDDFYTRESAGEKYNPLIDALTESIASDDNFNLFLEYDNYNTSGVFSSTL